ncbi:Acetyltransferase [Halomonadaceae bacterium LMG 33818]|uniref:GNAT family N-acetyltransferase n=1 Tax=Cernens ardua TaxID=3402176 RepID=UPI003EDC18A8
MTTKIRFHEGTSIEPDVAALTRILIDSVDLGASISFMAPLSVKDASYFWLENVNPEVIDGHRVLMVAEVNGQVSGTVQVITAMPPNQPQRCEVAKMIVHPDARGKGLGRRLMEEAIAYGKRSGKTLMTLDTRTGDVAEHLYSTLGFEVAGVIPDFSYDPNGKALRPTTYMYRYL